MHYCSSLEGQPRESHRPSDWLNHLQHSHTIKLERKWLAAASSCTIPAPSRLICARVRGMSFSSEWLNHSTEKVQGPLISSDLPDCQSFPSTVLTAEMLRRPDYMVDLDGIPTLGPGWPSPCKKMESRFATGFWNADRRSNVLTTVFSLARSCGNDVSMRKSVLPKKSAQSPVRDAMPTAARGRDIHSEGPIAPWLQ